MEPSTRGNAGGNVTAGAKSIVDPRNRKNVLLSTLQRLYPGYHVDIVEGEQDFMKIEMHHEHRYMIIVGRF